VIPAHCVGFTGKSCIESTLRFSISPTRLTFANSASMVGPGFVYVPNTFSEFPRFSIWC